MSRHNLRTGIEIILMAIIFISCVAFAYRALGNPVTLHHTATRIFDDGVILYRVKDQVMTVHAEGDGWDGSKWSSENARRDGLRKINKLYAAVIHEKYPIKQIHVTVTYYGKKEIERVLYIK
ncbi:hypothetical protein M3N64_02420 [Sporolactobacillus sp. CPB3-1]|uniref:DUF3889 domain-containing protein n=1 Tax=Sporolactobacillus mangiferae TaxID=2940498 RepID=A0ABT0M7F8_9BACL|nr:hypothetical protein [Sporolactobacillus mangiferae]MCL1630797.1 hypothetical protein [Sporolactobacillus mangiferae]